MRVRVLGALAAVPLALVLALAGCNSDEGGGADVASVTGGGASSTPSVKPSTNGHEMALKFAQCMRENGVNMADPEPGKGIMMKFDQSTNRETVDKAMEACKEFRPAGGTGAGPGGQNGEALLKFAQCMRDNGVPAFPDPSGNGLRITPEIGEDPDFPAAQQKCGKEFLPGATFQGGN